MENLSFFKRLRLLFDYLRIVNKARKEITDKNNKIEIRIDTARRFYTVCNCPDEVAKYGKDLAEKYIKEHVSSCEKMFINHNLTEFIGIWDIQQLDETNFLIVFGFKGFRTERLFRNIIILSTLTLGTAAYFFFNFL